MNRRTAVSKRRSVPAEHEVPEHEHVHLRLLEGLHGRVEAVTIASKILAVMAKHIDTPTRSYLVSVSIGIALYRGAPGSAEELLAVADDALYQAKKAGRNQFSVGTNDSD